MQFWAILWSILRHNGDDDASVLLLIEDGGWNSSLAAVASSSKGGVNIWYPLVMRACCFLWRAVADFCELLCSLWFFSDDIWLRSASIGFLPILALLRYWTADIWLLWQWCYGTAFKPVVDMQFWAILWSFRSLEMFGNSFGEEQTFWTERFLSTCSFVDFVKRCDVFETFLLVLNVDMMSQLWL